MFYSTASLQSLCLMKIVQQLDAYTPELLACLPPTLRRHLLVHLPIADVCQLEETCVFEDIGAETIWKELYELHIPRYFTALDNFPPHDVLRAKTVLEEKEMTWRDKLHSIIANIVLSRARPSGYFGTLTSLFGILYDYRRIISEKPPCDILAIAPVDIVNFLIAGERVSAVHVSGEDYQEEEEVDNHLNVTAMTDYHCGERERKRGEHFLDYCAYKETNEKLQCFPPRYSHYVQERNDCCRLSDEDAVVLLMDKCSFHPHSLFISVSAYSSGYWNGTLINQFLKNIVRLSLIFDKYVKGTTEMEQLLTAISSSPNPMFSSLDLSSLMLHNHKYSSLTDDHLVGDDHLVLLAQLSASAPSALASPLQTLRHLSVDGRFTADGLNQIRTVLSNQPMMTSLSLCSVDLFDPPHDLNCSEEFSSALSLFFHNPNFQSNITLKGTIFSLKMAQDVISSFLTSPCTQVQTLTLIDPILLRGDGDVASEKNFKQYPVPPESALQYKSLEICVSDIKQASNLSSWLFSVQPLKLKKLAVICQNDFHRRWDNHLSDVAQNTCFQVESLSLCVPNGVTAAAMATILKRETLKKLKLVYCSRAINFDELADNLLKQMPCRMLEELKIEESAYAIGKIATVSSPQTCGYFFDTMFSMPQLEDLSLELSLNYRHSSSEIIETMYESWKRNSRGRKPKQIVIRFLQSADISKERRRIIESETGLSMEFISRTMPFTPFPV